MPIPRLHKELNLYKKGAIKDDIENASNAYKAVITEVGTDGVKIHPSSQDGSQAHPITDYTLIDDDGMEVFDGGVSVAAFGEDGARIGKDDNAHINLDYRSLKLVDRNGNVFFKVEDLRDGEGYMTDTFEGDGSTKTFTMSFSIVANFSLTVDDLPASGYTVSSGVITFTTAPASGAAIVARYQAATPQHMKSFLFGVEKASGVRKGLMGFREGYETEAGADYSHAEGYKSKTVYHLNYSYGAHAEGYSTHAEHSGAHAEGRHTKAVGQAAHAEGASCEALADYSHAQGYNTIAKSEYQTVIGKYNEIDDQNAYAFIIGRGDNVTRRNALTVDWNGTLGFAGNVTDATGIPKLMTRTAWGTSLTIRALNGLVLINGRTLFGFWHPSGTLTITKIGGGSDAAPAGTSNNGVVTFTTSSASDILAIGM